MTFGGRRWLPVYFNLVQEVYSAENLSITGSIDGNVVVADVDFHESWGSY